MTDQIKKQLDELINKKFNYKGKIIKITRYKDVKGLLVVFTNSQTHNFRGEEIQLFINSLMPINKNDTSQVVTFNEKPKIAPIIVYEKSETHIKLETSLNTMIDKVMVSKDAIPQAQALCNIANTMINIEKQQINLLKATNKL